MNLKNTIALANNYLVVADSKYRLIPVGADNVAIVDAADFKVLNKHTWLPTPAAQYKYYASRSTDGALMHHQILGVEPGTRVVHILGDGLDNRKANLKLP